MNDDNKTPPTAKWVEVPVRNLSGVTVRMRREIEMAAPGTVNGVMRMSGNWSCGDVERGIGLEIGGGGWAVRAADLRWALDQLAPSDTDPEATRTPPTPGGE